MPRNIGAGEDAPRDARRGRWLLLGSSLVFKPFLQTDHSRPDLVRGDLLFRVASSFAAKSGRRGPVRGRPRPVLPKRLRMISWSIVGPHHQPHLARASSMGPLIR